MKKTIFFIGGSIIILIIVIVAIGLIYFQLTKKDRENNIPIVSVFDVPNMSYAVGGETFTLVNGKAEKAYASDSATKNMLSIFGQPLYEDLDKDNDLDAALWLVNNPGGSGVFYYAVLAINNGNDSFTTNALLLGDRIAPQTLEFDSGRALFNYAERKVGEPMITRPSMGKSLWIQYNPQTGQIGEWVKDFEGEADPARMTLGMKTWNWISTKYNNDTEVKPIIVGRFTIAFKNDKTFSVTTDCNSMGGKYAVDKNAISFTEIFTTEMYCEGSQDSDFSKMLGEVQSYLFTSKGELILELKLDTGSMIFK